MSYAARGNGGGYIEGESEKGEREREREERMPEARMCLKICINLCYAKHFEY